VGGLDECPHCQKSKIRTDFQKWRQNSRVHFVVGSAHQNAVLEFIGYVFFATKVVAGGVLIIVSYEAAMTSTRGVVSARNATRRQQCSQLVSATCYHHMT
jgi:hypothetical protein